MKKTLSIGERKPQLVTITDVAFTQVDSWYGHCVSDLKLDIIYPEDSEKKYPCIVWICGGGWLTLDKSAHLAYLAKLAHKGYVVASVEYRTSNMTTYPGQIRDVKAAIRYLKAHADRFNIDVNNFGTMGESAGGYLTAMAALATDKTFDVGEYLEYSSCVQAAVPWYPPTSFTSEDARFSVPGGPESLMLGFDVSKEPEKAMACCPVSFVTKEAPPMMIIHGSDDHVVPFNQSVRLYDALEKEGCDVTLVELEGADHADIRFFQDEIWDMIIKFFDEKLR